MYFDMYTFNIFVIFTFILCAQGLDLKLKYCRFRCSNSCETPEDKSNPVGSTNPPGAYYWRDFYGTIPPDAYPLGPSTQYPQTYIGMVYDPSKNGTYATTIYDGLSYVYTVFQNETNKMETHIQILCTKSPGQLSWMKLTEENIDSVLKTYINVRGSNHYEMVNDKKQVFYHFIVKTTKCRVTYAGVLSKLNATLEYALIDGSSATSDEYSWLMYNKEESPNNPETSGPSPSKSFFSHHYEYKIRPDSIIPQFYKQITIGSCSITCTNEGQSSINKIKNDPKLSSSMAYYWKPYPVIDKEEAFQAAINREGATTYVAQAYIYWGNIFDVGYSNNLKTASILDGRYLAVESAAYSILSTNYPDRLQWVNTTLEDFPNQDRNKLVPGGTYANGTETFVCRGTIYSRITIGSARVWPEGTYCITAYGGLTNYQILAYDSQ